jgi:histidine triad (HIT) family protein
LGPNYKYIRSLVRLEKELNENSCIFCDIITKKLPHVDVYEDDNFVVLMDKYPISRGHTLIIPKTHYDNLLLMPHNEVGRLYSLVPIIAGAIVTAVKADGFNVGQNNGKAANQIVPHVHVHIIPRFNDDSPKGRWPLRRVASHEELFKIADGIKRFLNPTLVNKE